MAAAAAVRRKKAIVAIFEGRREEGEMRAGRDEREKSRSVRRGGKKATQPNNNKIAINRSRSSIVVIRITISRSAIANHLSRGGSNVFLFRRERDERRTFIAATAEKAEESQRDLSYPTEKYYVRRRLRPYSAFVAGSLAQQCFAVAHNPQMRPPPPPPPQLLRRQAIAHNNLPRQYFFLRLFRP